LIDAMPSRSRRALVLVALAAALAGSPLLAQKQKETAASAGLVLPKFTKKALDDRFKGWELAAADSQTAACRPDGGGSPVFVQADFNGDGAPDVALAVKTGDGVRLIAVLARVEDGTVVDVDTLDMAGAYLSVEKRGTKFKDPVYGLDDYFAADTLAVRRCGQPTTIYRWDGAAFEKVVIP
jgi:hypothetical protein